MKTSWFDFALRSIKSELAALEIEAQDRAFLATGKGLRYYRAPADHLVIRAEEYIASARQISVDKAIEG